MVIAVSQGNVTLYDSEQSLLQGNQNLTDAMICVWNGGSVPKSEWLFLGDNVISPLAMTNSSWDMELLLCMVESDCELQQCGEVFTIQGIYHYRYITKMYDIAKLHVKRCLVSYNDMTLDKYFLPINF